eukprot:6388736-Amphidinium_carterae.1
MQPVHCEACARVVASRPRPSLADEDVQGSSLVTVTLLLTTCAPVQSLVLTVFVRTLAAE